MDEIQIVFALAVIYVTYRWWSRPSAPGTGSTSSSSAGTSGSAPNERLNHLANNMVPPSHIAQVQAMFPQLSERDIKWEFVRIGRVRNVEQVVQFLLDSPTVQPPAWFLPPVAVVQQPTTPSSTKSRSKYPSFIERLGLQEQAKEQDRQFAEISGSQEGFINDKGKSTDRRALDEWRSMSMQEKKAKVVLDARRRILEKDRTATPA